MHAAIREWGKDAFEYRHIACALSRKDLDETERLLIEQYDCYWPKGYNRTRGGSRTFAVGNPISFDGRHYGSFSELAATYGVDALIANQRVRRYSWTLRQALEIDPPPKHEASNSAKRTIVDGRSYPSFKAAAEAHSISEGKVRVRISKYGWTLEEAFGVVPRKRKNRALKTVTIDGVPHNSYAQAAKAYGMSPVLFRSRISSGWTPEQAVGLTAPPKKLPSSVTAISIGGHNYPSIPGAVKAFPHITLGSIRSRLRRGWTVEQAFELEPRPERSAGSSKKIIVAGQTYSSVRDAALKLDVSPQLVSKRQMRWGWTLEQALGVQPPPRRTSSAKARIDGGVVVGNMKYDSLSHACETTGISYSKVASRLHRGWSLDEAFGISYRKPKTRSA